MSFTIQSWSDPIGMPVIDITVHPVVVGVAAAAAAVGSAVAIQWPKFDLDRVRALLTAIRDRIEEMMKLLQRRADCITREDRSTYCTLIPALPPDDMEDMYYRYVLVWALERHGH